MRGACVCLLITFCLFVASVHGFCEHCESANECSAARCVDDDCQKINTGADIPGCCTTSNDCLGEYEGVSYLENCLIPDCNEQDFTCTNVWSCSVSPFPPGPVMSGCDTIEDCYAYKSECTNSHCDTYTHSCVITPISPSPVGCCTRNSDCMEAECKEAICDPYFSMCVYIESQEGECALSQQSDSITPSILANSVSMSPSAFLEISNSPTTSASPSISLAESLPSTSSSPSVSQTISISTIPLPSNSPSISVTVSQSKIASEISSASATISTSPSISVSVSSAESISTQISSSASGSGSAAEIHVTVQPLSSDIDSPGGFQVMLYIGMLILAGIIVAAVLIALAFVAYRKHQRGQQFQPIDFIDDDEFPM